jgi:hypothetical protein
MILIFSPFTYYKLSFGGLSGQSELVGLIRETLSLDLLHFVHCLAYYITINS